MIAFEHQLYLNIAGISAASGIVYHNNSLYLISDSSSYLYQYQLKSKKMNKIALDNNPQENIIKKDKPDFEAIALVNNEIHIFGSGSTQKRNNSKIYHLENKKVIEKDLSPLYSKLKDKFDIQDDQLNIEGAFFHNEKTYLFQRGNSANSSSGIFIIDNETPLEFKKISLPKLNSIEASFTDAILVHETIYFLAAVENTTSTYLDGEILGTFFGTINFKDFTLQDYTLISEINKFEGITLYQESGEKITFLLCEDTDTQQEISQIYKLTLNK